MKQMLTVKIGAQSFALPATEVEDIIGPQRIARVPLAPLHIAGVINLRGRVMTAVDMRRCLGMPPFEKPGMNVVVANKGVPYSLLVDAVGNVIAAEGVEETPPTVDAALRPLSAGVLPLEEGFAVLLDIAALAKFIADGKEKR